MFYSEAILSKKGPLAKVWLAAHWEKKLSKVQTLHTSIEQSVHAIVTEETAPMALRLSGQLMLGVVRIYSRKARYLLEDCTEALMRLKMSFQPGQVDMIEPATALQSLKGKDAVTQSANLTLPETITEFDLLVPDSTFDFQWSQLLRTPSRSSNTLELHSLPISSSPSFPSSQLSIEAGRNAQVESGFSLGESFAHVGNDMQFHLPISNSGAATPRSVHSDNQSQISIEVGRDAPAAAATDLSGIIGPQMTKSPASSVTHFSTPSMLPIGGTSLDDELLAPVDDLNLDLGLDDLLGDEQGANAPAIEADEQAETSSIHLPSDIMEDDSSRPAAAGVEEGQVVESATAPQQEKINPQKTVRRQRAIIDPVTELSSKQMKKQLADTSSITSPLCLNTSSIVFNATVNFTRNGKFNTSIFSSNLNPKVNELLQADFKQAILRKRKNESPEEVEPAKHQRTDTSTENQETAEVLDPEEIAAAELANITEAAIATLPQETVVQPEGEAPELGSPMGFPVTALESADDSLFDAPPVMLDEADLLGSERLDSSVSEALPSSQTAKDSLRNKWDPYTEGEKVSFQTLSAGCNREEAVQLFFDVLVLATKDVISVKQDVAIQNEITLTAKRGMLLSSL
ncbi:Cohesin subunit rad21 [Schizosaccharomyces pombe]|uniref:Cohesin subunit rad21 n=1 Tax=Schizosaccharomyces pombe (strain 972 / ATCC 24843) TaxID=284812 RepID=RAD21_SCHPO|nr:mitotic cohesin complex non-SMC subunit Rad21 [Schizosaccharomyces pombe]P30776.1 RecName: Full=Cohesin subunit rad21; AltName: Full=Double-strand-break repair protein rad21; AltName: Full=SCC1 homolog [Schizosaccharomyces pombe 972h-]AAA35330.1 putative [Schizosaccharomyces pombe]6YUF_B Chain B, Cohesin subunit rad21 [Schizosaccharomyces pombe 972h-]CAA19348.1 mitotic cohesin complex, non-SMC subunit Rad21 (kleisin) [Schizosaccharomyces pombe]|eukprot:NP_588151.1 mitotic cohesin complex non-SMC subunit Rad21 [Schizosaccharomyces pombe]